MRFPENLSLRESSATAEPPAAPALSLRREPAPKGREADPAETPGGSLPHAVVLYHYMYPDDVVSSVHFSELCAGLVARGWRVTAYSCNRACRDDLQTFPKRSFWNGVEFRHIWRPRLRQAGGLGRIGNAVWMTAAWSLLALNPRLRPQVLIVGTDPVFSPFVTLSWALLRPKLRLAHWCFDLYPDAAVADGMLHDDHVAVRLLKHALRMVYRRFHLVVDIGSCMRRCLTSYLSGPGQETIVPWALVECEQPSKMDPDERHRLFGDASLGLLYSGSFGRAHTWRGIPELAQALESRDGKIVFSVRGNGAVQLRSAIDNARAPISFCEFTTTDRLREKLSAADVHIVTLRDEWTGASVPSKFFGALAIGRPVLFVGSADSAIAQWIRQFDVGWILTPDNMEQLAIELSVWARTPGAKARMFEHCHSVYQRHFSRKISLDRWNLTLRELCSYARQRR